MVKSHRGGGLLRRSVVACIKLRRYYLRGDLCWSGVHNRVSSQTKNTLGIHDRNKILGRPILYTIKTYYLKQLTEKIHWLHEIEYEAKSEMVSLLATLLQNQGSSVSVEELRRAQKRGAQTGE